MKKISLEELMARSERCFAIPGLIRIAREAKSPTTAHDVALQEHFTWKEARACRYLAMIKRDYGKKVFQGLTKDRENDKSSYFSLLHFRQTAERFSYLTQLMHNIPPSIKTLPECDKPYLAVVQQAFDILSGYDSDTIRAFMEFARIDSVVFGTWIVEVRNALARAEKNADLIDYYQVQKMTNFMVQITSFLVSRAGITDNYYVAYDRVNDVQREMKELAKNKKTLPKEKTG